MTKCVSTNGIKTREDLTQFLIIVLDECCFQDRNENILHLLNQKI